MCHMCEQYTPEEIEQIRKQIKRANELAMAEVKKRGYTLHPRIAALKAKQNEQSDKT